MSRVFVSGLGAVSPAGWGVAAMRDALANGEPLPAHPIARPGGQRELQSRAVPAPAARPACLNHPRLRRASPISQYAVAAAIEALGAEAARVADGSLRLGVVLCVMSGCVNYSRRFYDEVLRDPATASPLVFPETVFNAPASHLGALLGTRLINYTLVGDPGTFLLGLATAADWLEAARVDACLVIGAEELDWLTADAFRLFDRRILVSAGAGALLLTPSSPAADGVELRAVTDAHSFTVTQPPGVAARRMRAQLPAAQPAHLLVDGRQGSARFDAAEAAAWKDWSGARVSPKYALGEGLAAASAWQCVAAVDALQQRRFTAASVSVVGCNQQAVGAQFVAPTS
jgi:3-oxoacyl-(acyl-carrier-protein) synthase